MADLDPGYPVVLGAADVLPLAWVRVGPPEGFGRVESPLQGEHY